MMKPIVKTEVKQHFLNKIKNFQKKSDESKKIKEPKKIEEFADLGLQLSDPHARVTL